MSIWEIKKITEHPELIDRAAQWFHAKWGVPTDAYKNSMHASLDKISPVPQWYVGMKGSRIIAGIGVIDNDFHDRKDLSPNVCAIFVEKEYRNQGIAGKMLDFVCSDMKTLRISTLYLVTDLISFYERYHWKFFDVVQGEEGPIRMYYHKS